MLLCTLAVGVKPVEDEIEAEVELLAEVVAGLQDVLDGECVECGNVLGELLVHDVVDDVAHVVARRGQRRFLDGEPVDEGIEQGIGVGGHPD